MSSISHRLIRLPVRIDRADTPVDADTGGVVRLWSGSPARLRFAFFNGDTLLGDFSGCSAVTVQLKALGAGSAPPLPTDNYIAEAVVTEFNAALTPEEWEAGTAWHAEVAVAGASLNVAAGTYWLVVVALLDQPTTLLAGKCEILQDGYGSGAGAPTPPEPAYTRAEADARYLPLSSVAPSGQDASSSQVPRGNAPKLVNGQAAYDALAPVRTLVSQGKTRRLLVPGTLATQPLVDSGYDVAKDNSTAGSTELVTGSDLRNGRRGGVALTVGGATVAGGMTLSNSIAVSGALTLGIELSPTAASSANRYIAAFGSGTSSGSVAVLLNTAGNIQFVEGDGSGGAVVSGVKTIPAGTRHVWCIYDATSGIYGRFILYFDSGDSAVTFDRTIPGALLPLVAVAGSGSNFSYTGIIRGVCALNFAALQADRIAAMRGEYPQSWIGGATTLPHAGAWTDNSWISDANGTGSITTNSGGTLSATRTASTASSTALTIADIASPEIRPGRTVRLSYNLALNSGVAPKVVLRGVAGGLWYVAASVSLAAGTNVLDIPVTQNVGNNLSLGLSAAAACDFVLSGVSLEVLGAVVLITPDGFGQTAAKDISGCCNDLRCGIGVVPLDPKPQERRLTLSLPATTIAGVGNASGIFEADVTLTASGFAATKALAAIRAGDSVDVRLSGRLPNGMLLKQGARVVSNGVVALGVLNLNGSDESTGTIACELTHVIR